MIVLGIETSCDETGVALYNTAFWENRAPAHQGILGQALHSQIAMHQEYGGVVPELASRDHIRRVLPLLDDALHEAKLQLKDIDAIAYTQGPGLAGACWSVVPLPNPSPKASIYPPLGFTTLKATFFLRSWGHPYQNFHLLRF